MQVCVLHCGVNNNSKVGSIAKSVADGIESNGHTVTVLNGLVDTDKRLTIYDYLVVVSEPVSFFSGKTPAYISKYLENAGQISGKRAACVITGGLRANKALLSLMRIVESQGVILKTSDVLKKNDTAKAFGSHLKVERNF